MSSPWPVGGRRCKLAAGLALVLLLGAMPVAADRPDAATKSDVQRLKDDLDLLDDSLSQVGMTHARSLEFRERADRIRDDVIWLRGEMGRNQRGRGESALGASWADVAEIREAIAALRNDIDASLGLRRAAVTRDLRIPEGTEMQVRLEDRLSSETARPEDRFVGTVARSIRVDGRSVIPAGTRVRGTVRFVEPAHRPQRGGRMDLAFDSLVLDDGTRVNLSTRVVRLEERIDKSETGKRAGLGALLGGILGGVIDGREGAIVGVLVGGTGGVMATKGEEVELPPGTILTLRLDRPAYVASR